MNYDKIGKFITTSRKKKGLTQKELANQLHITDRAVSKWERGKGCPDVSLLEELSKILDVSIIEILKGEKINNKEKVDKEELIYSMKYLDNSIKNKIRNVINIVIITLISIVILLILFNNLKIHILFNHQYYPNITFVDSNNVFEEVENKINLINTNQQTKAIINIINKYKEEDKKLYEKEYYTYNDIKTIILRDNSNSVNSILKLLIYNISNKDINWNKDIEYFATSYYENEKIIKKFINNCYKYNYSYNEEESIGNKVKSLIHYKYYIYSLILEDIVNGGDINE